MSAQDGCEPEPLVDVYVTNATRTSQGPGPGPKRLPVGEASKLLRLKYAISGDQPPRGMGGEPEPAVKVFDGQAPRGYGSGPDDGLRH